MYTTKFIAVRALLACLAAGFYLQSAQASIAIEQWTQASGAQVFLATSPAIPMVDVQLDFDAGSRRDPPAQMGLASSMAGQISNGVRAANGEAALDENALGEAWADLGASFGASASTDRLSFSLRSLTYPDLLQKAAQLAARQIALPAFAAPLWERDRKRSIAALAEANTKPATVAGRAFAKAVYGRHPYGYEPTAQSLQAISVADMQAFHMASVLPCRAKVSIVGALNKAQADALVSTLLARLPQGAQGAACPALPAVPEVAPLTQASEQRIAFHSAQAHVYVGQPGYARRDADFFALTVGNYVLGGGGFVSRLTAEVREKRGLSYSVYSYFNPGLHAGAFSLGLQTRPDQAAQALQVAREVLAKFVREGPTEAELQAAKNNLIGGFGLRIDSNRKLLDNIANIAWNGLPLSYLDTWTQQVDKLTVADIKAAFARKLQPEKMATVVLGAGE